MKFLVTGANGFVGQAFSAAALLRGVSITGSTRAPAMLLPTVKNIVVGEVDEKTDWTLALGGCDVVVHLAARVHVMQENNSNPLEAFRAVNLYGTTNLARQAAKAGVKRLVYVSSVKVNGEETQDGQPYTEESDSLPKDAYGTSKWEAEQALHEIANETGLEVVIIRPPLVYGAGVKGNFAQMMSVVSRGVPLPLARINNKRSLLNVKNLADAILLCATHPAATGNTYLVSDGEDISTSDLLYKLSQALRKNARFFFCPVTLLKLAGRAVGKAEQVSRLLSSLQIDSSKIRKELGWIPPFSLEEGLKDTVQNWLYD